MINTDLLRIPVVNSGSRVDIYSGVARLSGVIWASHVYETSRRPSVAVMFVHPTSNFLGHYALRDLAEIGVGAVGLTTRYVGNDSCLLMENCVLDIASAIQHLRRIGYERVVLVGNSGGGALTALYQSQAEKPTLRATPAGDPPDLTSVDLPSADKLILAMAHPGRARTLTESLDASIVDEARPLLRDPSRDIFNPDNGPTYSAEFLRSYRASQIARNRRITNWVLANLDRASGRAASGTSEAPDDLPFVVHGTAADPRFLDLSIEPSKRAVGTIWGPAHAANFAPHTLAHLTSLRSWLSQWSYDHSQADSYIHLPSVTVPVQVIYGTADAAVFPSHVAAMFDCAGAAEKELVEIDGADHYFRGQPELARQMCEHIVRWAIA